MTLHVVKQLILRSGCSFAKTCTKKIFLYSNHHRILKRNYHYFCNNSSPLKFKAATRLSRQYKKNHHGTHANYRTLTVVWLAFMPICGYGYEMMMEEENVDDSSEEELNFIQYSGKKKKASNNNMEPHKSGLQQLASLSNNDENNNQNSKRWKHCSAISCYLTIGHRQHMEDEYYISKDGTFFAVYDGHGGDQVSKYLSDHFYSIYKKFIDGQSSFLGLSSFGKDYKDALIKTFQQIQNEVFKRNELDHVGSTCVGVLLTDGSICSFNVGDSRAVLCRNGKAIDLTVDHKPNDPTEAMRIKALGGFIYWDGYRDENGKPIPGHGCYRVNGNLAMSRAIGDKCEAPCVTGIPDIQEFERKYTQDKFIIIASDGLWDVMSSQEAVDFVLKNMVSIGPLQLNSSSSTKFHNTSNRNSNNRFLNNKWTSSFHDILSDNDENRTTIMENSNTIRTSLQHRRELMSQYLVGEALSRKTTDNTTAIVIWLQ